MKYYATECAIGHILALGFRHCPLRILLACNGRMQKCGELCIHRAIQLVKLYCVSALLFWDIYTQQPQQTIQAK